MNINTREKFFNVVYFDHFTNPWLNRPVTKLSWGLFRGQRGKKRGHFAFGIISGSIWGSFQGRDHFGAVQVYYGYYGSIISNWSRSLPHGVGFKGYRSQLSVAEGDKTAHVASTTWYILNLLKGSKHCHLLDGTFEPGSSRRSYFKCLPTWQTSSLRRDTGTLK